MSFRVLVIPENPTHNGAILKPLFERMMTGFGRPNAKVAPLRDPHVNGKEDMDRKLPAIIEKYRHFDLLIAVRDADGKDPAGPCARIESNAKDQGATLLCVAPRQEVEIWCLAGFSEQLDRPWKDVRSEVSLKESVYDPFARRLGLAKYPDLGRGWMMAETLRNYQGLLAKCDELAGLESRIRLLL